MSTCVYSKPHRCLGEATHFVAYDFSTLSPWVIHDTPWQLEMQDGFKMTKEVFGANGKPLKNADGGPAREPVMHVKEFCREAAQAVCAQRNKEVL